MAGDSLSVVGTSVGAYYVPKKAKKQPINPSKDKVYVDPKTGEYTTWKPGIYDPKQEESKKAAKIAVTLMALSATALIAYMFRGRIRNNGETLLKKAQPYAQEAYKRAAGVINSAKDFVKPYIESSRIFIDDTLAAIKNYFVPAAKAAAKPAGA